MLSRGRLFGRLFFVKKNDTYSKSERSIIKRGRVEELLKRCWDGDPESFFGGEME